MALKLPHKIVAKAYDYVMKFINSQGRGNYGPTHYEGDFTSKGMAATAAAGGIIAGVAQRKEKNGSKEKAEERGKENNETNQTEATDVGPKWD